jgi:hypothetical protein
MLRSFPSFVLMSHLFSLISNLKTYSISINYVRAVYLPHLKMNQSISIVSYVLPPFKNI